MASCKKSWWGQNCLFFYLFIHLFQAKLSFQLVIRVGILSVIQYFRILHSPSPHSRSTTVSRLGFLSPRFRVQTASLLPWFLPRTHPPMLPFLHGISKIAIITACTNRVASKYRDPEQMFLLYCTVALYRTVHFPSNFFGVTRIIWLRQCWRYPAIAAVSLAVLRYKQWMDLIHSFASLTICKCRVNWFFFCCRTYLRLAHSNVVCRMEYFLLLLLG